MRPLFRWVGGKSSLADTLMANLPPGAENLRYLEPFAGGAALFWRMKERWPDLQATISDSNRAVMWAYFGAKCAPVELHRELESLQVGGSSYASARDEFNTLLREGDLACNPWIRAAALFLHLNARGYNGLYRVNASGEYNTPEGRVARPRTYTLEELQQYSATLSDVGLSWSDYRLRLGAAGEDDFVYVDPPYDVPAGSKSFTTYTKSGFGQDHQRELADQVKRAVGRGALVMLSNADTPLTRELYADMNILSVQGRRSIGCCAASRGYVPEILALSYTPPVH